MKIRKRLILLFSAGIAVLLALACAFMLAPKITARADTEDEDTNVAQVEFGNGGSATCLSIEGAWDIANMHPSATVTLLADAETTVTLTVASGKDITLDLNGHMLKYNNDSWARSVIAIQGGTFTLEDKSDKTTTHTITSPVTNEEVTINGGLITGGTGSGVYVVHNYEYYGCIAGTFTMTGGTISGNTSPWSGGGVFVDGGDYELLRSTFIMSGGTISENKAGDNGGGVFVAQQEIAGGESLNLTARSNNVNKSGDEEAGGLFKMTGGTISGNAAGSYGGGVFVASAESVSDVSCGKFEISGAPVITGNKVNGVNDNVYLQHDFSGDNAIVTVAGELTEGAKMGVTLADGFSGALTEGYGENNKDANGNIIVPSTYFVSDKNGYFPTLENGEVNLSEGVATVTVDGNVTAYGSLEEAWTYANGATTAAIIKMYADAETTDTLTVASGKNITLDLNGHMIKYNNESAENSVITVEGTFTLCDGVGTGTVTGGTGKDGYGGGVYVNANCNFTMTGGTITGNNVSLGGGGVCVYGGTFTMKNGTISENTSHDYGGGVYVVNGGDFTMSGGSINGNQVYAGGGGVIIDSGCTFTMTGGEVKNNAARICGGVSIFGTFKVSGCPKITGNTGEALIDGEIKTVEFNVDLQNNAKINVIGALEEGAQIGVYNTGEIATGYTQYDKPSEYFIPDDRASHCVYVSDETSGTVTIGTHDMVQHEAQQPTCTESGWQEYEGCSRCDYSTNKVEIDALGHNYGEWTVTKEATETEEGEERRVCANDETHYETRTVPKVTPTPAEDKKSYWWLFWLLIPLAIGVGGVTLGIWVYKNDKKNNRL